MPYRYRSSPRVARMQDWQLRRYRGLHFLRRKLRTAVHPAGGFRSKRWSWWSGDWARQSILARRLTFRPCPSFRWSERIPALPVGHPATTSMQIGTMVLVERRLGEAKYPRQTVDFPSLPVVSVVRTDSSLAGWASGDHFNARPIIRF